MWCERLQKRDLIGTKRTVVVGSRDGEATKGAFVACQNYRQEARNTELPSIAAKIVGFLDFPIRNEQLVD